MKKDYIVTMQQAQEQVKLLEDIFDVVRLLDAQSMCEAAGEDEKQNIGCNDIWEKDVHCSECIVKEAVRTKSEVVKAEYIDSSLYQIIAKYLQIDGKDYVLEMINELDAGSMFSEKDCGKFIDSCSQYADKLYEDVLTDTYNRRYYEEKLKKLETRAAIAVIDLDDFKLYNDTYGHSAGDMALVTTAGVIKKCIRKGDVLIRYGGDEFLLVLPELDMEGMKQMLGDIRDKICKADVPGYSRLQLSVSIGGIIAGGGTIEKAVARADMLMYQAKNRKNLVITEDDVKGDMDEEDIQDIERSKQQILIVDDSEMNRELLTAMLQDEYRILEACNGQEAVDMLSQYGTGIALVLLDIIMPVMDGFGVLGNMNSNHMIEDIPVIMISNEDSDTVIRHAYEMGVIDYIRRPFDSKIVYQRVSNTIKLYAKQRRLMALVSENIYQKEKNNKMMIAILSQIVEFRNGESGMHVVNINGITRLLLEQLIQRTDKYELSWQDRFLITTASALHDIGKIGIDESILNKPGRLTPEEFAVMKTHTLIGAEMLEKLEMYQDEKLVQVATQICRWHHERYDGKGYPDGLKGDEIPIAAQVVSVADVYDALTSERVYKKAFTHEKAMEMILGGECGAFNPLLLECLNDIQDKLKRREYQEDVVEV